MTHHVKTMGELRDAWDAASRSDAEIVLDADIDMQGEMLSQRPPVPTSIIVRGATPAVTLRGNRWWTDGSRVDSQGFDIAGMMLDFGHASVRLQDLVIADYAYPGAAVRVELSPMVTVSGVTFRNIGQHAYRPTTTQVTHSRQTIATQCLGGWSGRSNVTVARCVFEDCCRGNLYNNCVYFREKKVTILGCTFRRCGPMIDLAGVNGPVVVNNTVEEPAATNNRWRWLEYPHFIYIGDDVTRMTCVGNILSGNFTRVYNNVDPTKHMINRNDYSGVRIVAPGNTPNWCEYGSARHEWSEWQAAGADLHSVGPGQ